jgi:hypothetical protein
MLAVVLGFAVATSIGLTATDVRSDNDDETRIEELLRTEQQIARGSVRDASVAQRSKATNSSVADTTQPSVPVPGAVAEKHGYTTKMQSASVDSANSRTIEFGDLANYVGRLMQIDTVAGSHYVVTILSAGPAEIRVNGRQVGGTFEFTLKRRQIARIEKM